MFSLVKGAEQRRSAEPPASPPAPPDDLLPLAKAAAVGEEGAATTLMMALGEVMLTAVRKILGAGHPDVPDVTQDAMIALMAALPTFRAECSVVHFARRVAVLTAMAARRRWRTRRRWTEPSESVDSMAEHGEVSPWSRTLAGARRDMVRQVLDELPVVIAEALALHFVLGYTVDEIAASSSVPANTVWSRLRLGKQALRRKLAKDRRFADLMGEGS